MTRAFIPQEVLDLAHARSAARVARDWAEADRLRIHIEGAGWKVVDSGTNFRLERVEPSVSEADGAILYGRSDAVPSQLDEPAEGHITVVLVALDEPDLLARALASLDACAPTATQVVIVADGWTDAQASGLPTARADGEHPSIEVVRTSGLLGWAAALNIGIRRATGSVVVFLDGRAALRGDALTPLVDALADPTVAVVGAAGVRTEDLRRFEDVGEGEAVAIRGDVLAFRRADAQARGPLDEGFRVPRHLDIWWSLVLRDEGEDGPPRRALVLGGLPMSHHDDARDGKPPAPDEDRLAKRNVYRLLDRFRDRADLLFPDG